jgi:8-oxo-dGTP pyrophosphatase MutT (NUDIX family)
LYASEANNVPGLVLAISRLRDRRRKIAGQLTRAPNWQSQVSIPAGKIEDKEDVKTAAQREVFEETAININDQELKFLGMIPRYSRDGKRMKGLMYVYMVEAERAMNPDLDEAIDGDEHTECGYFTVEDMKPLAIDAFLYKLFEFISE